MTFPDTDTNATHPALVSLNQAALAAHAAGTGWDQFWGTWEATVRRWAKTPRRYRVMRVCLYRRVLGLDRPAGRTGGNS